jgi:NADPH-dependent 2,4-dienoyl-CoA reductase/sulfur reductase-like enzyme
VEGLESFRGIFPVRNLPEAKRVHEGITKDHRIVVLGGGLVGVKTAVHLRASDFRVSIVEKEDHLLPQALTAGAARFVEDHLRQMGIELFLGRTLEGVEGEKGTIGAVRFGGKQFPCDTLLIAAGSTPNVSFLEGSGLLEGGNLSVSTALQTRDSRIFAAGDAVTILAPDGKKLTPWTWPQAVSQGKLAAENLYRPQPVPLKILTRPNSLNLQGLPLALLGAPVGGSEEISCAPARGGVFRQAFLRDGRLIGGALLGDIASAGPLHHLMIQGKRSASEVSQMIKAEGKAIPQNLLDRGLRRRRAWVFHGEEKKPC